MVQMGQQSQGNSTNVACLKLKVEMCLNHAEDLDRYSWDSPYQGVYLHRSLRPVELEASPHTWEGLIESGP